MKSGIVRGSLGRKGGDNSNNRWPETSTPARSSALRVGWAYESVKTIITLDLEDKWDSSKDYQLTFQWALADHGSLTGRNFKAMIYGCSGYQYNIFGPTGPVPVEGARSYPLDGLSSPRGALIKEVNLDPLGETPFGEVQNQTILISGAEIEAANQNGSQIYFGFHKGANTEFLMVDNVTFQEAGTEPEPGPKMPELGISQGEGGLRLSWVGNPGMLYRIRKTNDLSAAVSSWSIVEEGISSDPALNSKDLSTEETSQFYILEEYSDPNLP